MAVNILYFVIPMFMKCYVNYFRQLCSLSSVLHCLTEATQNSGKMQCQYGEVQRYGKCPLSRRCQHDFQGTPAYVDHKIFSTAPFFIIFFKGSLWRSYPPNSACQPGDFASSLLSSPFLTSKAND